MNGPVSNLQLLLSSPDLTTLMTTAEYINRKADHDAQLRAQLEAEMAQLKLLQEQQREQQAVLEGKRGDLQKQSADLVAQSLRQKRTKQDLEAQQDQISDTQNEIFGMIDQLQSQSKEAQRIIEKERRAREELERKLDALLADKLESGEISKDVENNGKMQWPFPYKGCYISSSFGATSGRDHAHRGIDISIADKSRSYDIIAALDGVVVTHGFDSSMGYYVVILHGYYAPTGKYIKTTYMHMKTGSFTSAVVDNARIRAGTAIGVMGSTGNSTGPHLHFQVNEFTDSSMKNSNAVNPLGRYVTNTYA
ncbi:MAG: peptidoglycan DD-metalloendopeptidase family protein, partial [Oscillospiraceae bacterium]|jgi:murein DD-endopeptidase MepM/ murein hydrolase activator NlpD|nr:peptidoglycan DD-metalloendopeptidase family protein [Oscillospiraceae bacterium]